jgi:hypothetical protein
MGRRQAPNLDGIGDRASTRIDGYLPEVSAGRSCISGFSARLCRADAAVQTADPSALNYLSEADVWALSPICVHTNRFRSAGLHHRPGADRREAPAAEATKEATAEATQEATREAEATAES